MKGNILKGLMILFFLILSVDYVYSDILNAEARVSISNANPSNIEDIKGYLLYQKVGSQDLIYEEINNYTDTFISDEFFNRTYYINKNLDSGNYRYTFITTNSGGINSLDYNYSNLNFNYANPSPEFYIVADYYIKPSILKDKVILRERAIYKNVGPTDFLDFEIYDVFRFLRNNCKNQRYYTFDEKEKEVIPTDKGNPFVRTVDRIPAYGGERGFIVECELQTDSKDIGKKFVQEILFETGDKGLNLKSLTRNIHFPKTYFLKRLDFNFIHPDTAPIDEGDSIVIKYTNHFERGGAYLWTWINYRYKFGWETLLLGAIGALTVILLEQYFEMFYFTDERKEWIRSKFRIKNTFKRLYRVLKSIILILISLLKTILGKISKKSNKKQEKQNTK